MYADLESDRTPDNNPGAVLWPSLAGGGIAVQLGAGEDFWIAVILGPGTDIAFGSAGMPSSLAITTPGSFADGLPLSFPTNFTQLNVTPKLYAVMRM